MHLTENRFDHEKHMWSCCYRYFGLKYRKNKGISLPSSYSFISRDPDFRKLEPVFYISHVFFENYLKSSNKGEKLCLKLKKTLQPRI